MTQPGGSPPPVVGDAPFDGHWVALARASELDAKGVFQTRTIGTEPVVILRNGTGELRAHLNVCRHRGSQILEGCGQVKSLMCPYHGWLYSLDGELRGAPEMKYSEGFDKANFPLIRFPVSEWGGFVMVGIGVESAVENADLDQATLLQLANARSASTWTDTVQGSWHEVLAAVAQRSADGWTMSGSGRTLVGNPTAEGVENAVLVCPNLLILGQARGWTALSVTPGAAGRTAVVGYSMLRPDEGLDDDAAAIEQSKVLVAPTAQACDLADHLLDWTGASKRALVS